MGEEAVGNLTITRKVRNTAHLGKRKTSAVHTLLMGSFITID